MDLKSESDDNDEERPVGNDGVGNQRLVDQLSNTAIPVAFFNRIIEDEETQMEVKCPLKIRIEIPCPSNLDFLEQFVYGQREIETDTQTQEAKFHYNNC